MLRSRGHVVLWRLAVLALAGCGDQHDRSPYEIPDEDRQTYRMDCAVYCPAEAACLSVPEDSDCEDVCGAMKDKGAFQSAYLDTRFDCVTGLGAGCDQQQLDECWAQALAACLPAAGLDPFTRTWCTRWLECSGSSPDLWLERCLDDFRATPDQALFECFTDAALLQFGRCLQDATCEQVVDLPLLNYCAGIFL